MMTPQDFCNWPPLIGQAVNQSIPARTRNWPEGRYDVLAWVVIPVDSTIPEKYQIPTSDFYCFSSKAREIYLPEQPQFQTACHSFSWNCSSSLRTADFPRLFHDAPLWAKRGADDPRLCRLLQAVKEEIRLFSIMQILIILSSSPPALLPLSIVDTAKPFRTSPLFLWWVEHEYELRVNCSEWVKCKTKIFAICLIPEVGL